MKKMVWATAVAAALLLTGCFDDLEDADRKNTTVQGGPVEITVVHPVQGKGKDMVVYAYFSQVAFSDDSTQYYEVALTDAEGVARFDNIPLGFPYFKSVVHDTDTLYGYVAVENRTQSGVEKATIVLE